MSSVTIRAKLERIHEELGGYIVYIFRNCDLDVWYAQYISTVRFPNWEQPFIKEGDTGFLSFKEVIAGVDTWWDGSAQKFVKYKYDNVIFLKFIPDKDPKATTVIL